MTRAVQVFSRSTNRKIAVRFGHSPPTTDAIRKLRNGPQGTKIWRGVRTKTVGASEISVLMLSQHPYHSKFSLWHVKRHGWGVHEMTPEQQRGHWMEPGIAAKFRDEHPEVIVAAANAPLWADPQFPWMSCSPDYLVYDESGLLVPLECKAVEGGDGWGYGDEDVPAHYWWQVQQQCGVFAAPYGYLARWSNRGFRVYRIAFDEIRYWAAAEQARLFLADVKSGHEPEPDGHPTTEHVLRDLYPDSDESAPPVRLPREWGDELAALKESKREINRQIKQYENMARAMMGAAANAYDLSGRRYTRTKTPRRAYSVKEAIIDSLTINDPKEAS
jgi:predicted phage-related endonuclease